MSNKKIRLDQLARNRDAGIRTEIPIKGQVTLRPDDVAKLTDVLTPTEGVATVTPQQEKEVVVGQIDKTAVPQYVLAKRYVPKTDRNIETWGKITKALEDGPKTLAELAKAVESHRDFVGYMVRGGHIAPTQTK